MVIPSLNQTTLVVDLLNANTKDDSCTALLAFKKNLFVGTKNVLIFEDIYVTYRNTVQRHFNFPKEIIPCLKIRTDKTSKGRRKEMVQGVKIIHHAIALE